MKMNAEIKGMIFDLDGVIVFTDELHYQAWKEMFHAISDGTNISKSKPDPEVFLKAAQYLGLEPGQCLVIA